MITSFIQGVVTLFQREPVRILALVAAVSQALYAQLSGGATLENALIAAGVILVGELQRSQVSPVAR